MKKISVVVPCYNAVKYLDKCIISLLQQTIGIENMEIILVDDTSTDDGETRGLIKRYEKQFPDTITAVFLEQNLRQGGARNVGISYATGKYLIFCDADDWLLKETLEHCYEAAEKYEADVVEFLFREVNDHEISVDLERGERNRLIVLDTEEKRKKFLLQTDENLSLGSQKKFYRMSIIKDNQIAFEAHRIFEEPSFTVPVRFYEKRHFFLDEKLYMYFLSPGSTMRSSGWGDRRWDNLFVWTALMEEMDARGAFLKYRAEMEYLFFDWGFGLSLCLPFQKKSILTKEEVMILASLTRKLFPDILQNIYVQQKNNWNCFLCGILEREASDLGITDTDMQKINVFLSRGVK